MHQHPSSPLFPVLEVALKGCHDASEQAGLEDYLAGLPGVQSVHLDRTRALAHLSYDPAQTSPEVLRARLEQDGYPCTCQDCRASCCQPGHPAVGQGDEVGQHHEHRLEYRQEPQPTKPAPAIPHDHPHQPSNPSPTMSHDPTAMGHTAAAHTAMAHEGHDEHAGHGAAMVEDMLRRFLIALLLTVPIVLFSPIGGSLGFTLMPPLGLSMAWFGLILSTPVVWWGGWPFISAAWRALRRGEANMMTLIALGILVSYTYSLGATLFLGETEEVFFEAAAMLTTFSLVGHWLEMRSRFATGRAVEALLKLAPATARVLRDGQEVELSLEQVVVGDEVVVKPGDRVPVDGEVLSGSSYVDESMITGEPIPVAKTLGAKVIGGTLNQNGAFNFRATAVGADTALARIVQLVRNAQASKAPAQRLADQAGKVLVFIALGAGLLTFIYWAFFGGNDLVFALTAAVSAIVIACPDALALATPTAITVGVGQAARGVVQERHRAGSHCRDRHGDL